MKRGMFLGVVVCTVITIAHAESPTTNHGFEREVAFDGCHFKITDLYGGRVTGASYFATINPKANHPFETWIQFYCEKSSADKAFLAMGMKRSSSQWVLAEDSYKPLPEEHVAVYPLQNASWTGAAMGSDQTTGDLNDRMRQLGFCLTNMRQILCGSIQQVMFVGYPKESTLPQVIQLLESIEFIDTPSGPSINATTAAPSQP